MVTRFNLNRPVIAITGSAGKSTTKEMLAAILQTHWTILKSVDNWNFINHTQKYKLQIKPWHQAIVLEYGMSKTGHIRRHCQIIRPNIGIITNVGSAHIGNFGGNIHKLAAAKSELIKNMIQTGTLILNADDNNSNLLKTEGFKGKVITVGIDNKADYQADHVRYTNGGMIFHVKIGGYSHAFFIPIYGKHQVYNALNAIAAAHILGFTASEIKQGLSRYHKMESRLIVHYLQNRIKIIDDSFSANPQAAKAAIDVLSSIGKNDNVAIMGSMLALGTYTHQGHTEVGAYLAKKNVHYILTYGNHAKWIGIAAIANGFPKNHVQHFSNRALLNHAALTLLKPGTTILVKGSHGIGMKNTVQYILQKSHI